MPLLTDLVDALQSGSARVVDLTQPLSERTPVLGCPSRSPTRRGSAAASSAATTTAARRGRGTSSRSASTSARTSTPK